MTQNLLYNINDNQPGCAECVESTRVSCSLSDRIINQQDLICGSSPEQQVAVTRLSWCLQTAAALQTHEEETEQDGDAHEEDAGGSSQGDM